MLINREHIVNSDKRQAVIVNTNTPFMEYHDINDYIIDGLCAPYHYFIKLNGDIQTGLTYDEASDIKYGHNKRTMTICYVGNEKDGMLEQQKLSIQMILDFFDLKLVYLQDLK